MQSHKFDLIKQKHPKLRGRLSALAEYITRELNSGRDEIVPAIAGQYLNTSEGEVLGLLMLLEKAGLLKPFYQVRCRDKGAFLLEIPFKEQIPEAIRCKFCDEEHADPNDIEIDLVFKISDSAREVFPQGVASPKT